MSKKIISFLLAIIFLTGLTGCTSSEDYRNVKFGGRIFGSLTIDGDLYSAKDSRPASEAIFKRMAEIDDAFNTTKNSSEIYIFNESKSTDYIEISALFYHLLLVSKEYYEGVTEGYFNPAVYPLVELWGMTSSDLDNKQFSFSPPDIEEVQRVMEYCNFDDIQYKEENGKYYIKKNFPESKIDFGAVAKGYAADEAVRIAKEKGITNANIDISGNRILLNGHPEDRPWHISIENPRDIDDSWGIIALKLKDTSAVASGDYKRYRIYGGVRYTHIINPKTGIPANVYYDSVNNKYTNINPETGKYDGVVSAVIINESSMMCDIYSTTMLLFGIEKASEFLFDNNIKGILNTEDERMSVIGTHEVYWHELFEGYKNYSLDGFEKYGEFK